MRGGYLRGGVVSFPAVVRAAILAAGGRGLRWAGLGRGIKAALWAGRVFSGLERVRGGSGVRRGNWGDRVGKSAAMREDRGSCGRFGVLGGAGEGLGSVGELGRCCKRRWGDFGSLHEGKLWPAGCFGVPDRFFVGLSR